jgi:hypothetical protein
VGNREGCKTLEEGENNAALVSRLKAMALRLDDGMLRKNITTMPKELERK